jgi:hypothetical protein
LHISDGTKKEGWKNGVFDPFKKGFGLHGTLPKKPLKAYVGAKDEFARKCRFTDKFEYEAVKDYLFLNGGYSIVDVRVSIVISLCRLYLSRGFDCIFKTINVPG